MKNLEKFFTAKMCITELNKVGVFRYADKSLKQCSYKELGKVFKSKFKYNPFIDDLTKDIKKSSNVNYDGNNYICVFVTEGYELCKIVYTNNPTKKLKEEQINSPYKIIPYLVFKGNRSVEFKIHELYDWYRVQEGSLWFKFADTKIERAFEAVKSYYDYTSNVDEIDVENFNLVFRNRQKSTNGLKAKFLYCYYNMKSNLCKFVVSEKDFSYIKMKITDSKNIKLLSKLKVNDDECLSQLKIRYKENIKLNSDWYTLTDEFKREIKSGKILQ